MTGAPTISRRTRSFPRVQGALLALVAALVVGILGMHALPAHGSPPAQATGSSVPAQERAHRAAIVAGTSHDDHTHSTAAQPSGHGAAAASSRAGTEHDLSSMVMLCIVMLAAAAMTVLLLVAGVFRRVSPAAFRPAAVRDRTRQWVRGTGPPHAWQFSVIRC